jgi:hypothetical protein
MTSKQFKVFVDVIDSDPTPHDKLKARIEQALLIPKVG